MSGGQLLEGEEALTVGEGEVVSVLESVLNRPSLTPQCRNYALTALMKLSVRFSSQSERIKVSSQPCRLSRCLRQNYFSESSAMLYVLPRFFHMLGNLWQKFESLQSAHCQLSRLEQQSVRCSARIFTRRQNVLAEGSEVLPRILPL